MKPFLLLPLSLVLILGNAQGQPLEEFDPEAIAGIRLSSERYVEAFNQYDAKSIANLWVEDATYITSTGIELQGRAQIEEAFAKFFENNPGVSIGTVDSEILSVSGEWAAGSGIVAVTFEDGTVDESEYLVYWRKVGDEWLIQAEGETDPEDSPSPSFFLRDLEWLIGNWRDEGDEVTVESSYEWSIEKNDIRGSFKVIRDGDLEMDGVIRIGWDPIEGNIRSWTFDSDGGDAEGAWYEQDGKWYIKKLHVMPDGQVGSSVSVFNPIDANHIEWKSISREVGGEILPDVGPVKMVRISENQ
ncbi:MAG: nuclear transport factor 2 family protein [Candidatus Omnitrophica bacterium]|nr:nuclear transport factor 2 family protein [Candidatus Omnitrophota bacterium]